MMKLAPPLARIPNGLSHATALRLLGVHITRVNNMDFADWKELGDRNAGHTALNLLAGAVVLGLVGVALYAFKAAV